jgi:hypothetical protein
VKIGQDNIMSILSGNLSVVDLFGILELARQMPGNIVVHIQTTHDDIAILLNNGEIIHAFNQHSKGEAVLVAALGIQNGSFHIEKGEVDPERTISIPWNTLLLQRLQRLDETQNTSLSSTSDVDTLSTNSLPISIKLAFRFPK